MSAPNQVSLCIDIPLIAAGTDEDRYAVHGWPGEWQLSHAYLTPAAATPAHAANYTTIELKNGAGTVLGSLNTSTGSGAAFVEGTAQRFTLTGGAALEFGNADAINIEKSDSGAGGLLDCSVTLSFTKIHV